MGFVFPIVDFTRAVIYLLFIAAQENIYVQHLWDPERHFEVLISRRHLNEEKR